VSPQQSLLPFHFHYHGQVDLTSKQRHLEYTLQEDSIEERERIECIYQRKGILKNSFNLYILFSKFHLLFKLFIFCRYLATGTTITALHYDYRLGISKIRKIVLSVCNDLRSTLKNEFFPESTEERSRETSDAFRKCSLFLTVWEQSMGST